jgi:hypothetical protein
MTKQDLSTFFYKRNVLAHFTLVRIIGVDEEEVKAGVILRAIITVIFGDNNQSNIIPIAIYLSVAVFFTIVDLFLNLRMFKTPEYKSKIKNAISLLNP